jgi:signal transduction histidine kinase/ActR/RegA family two-component response regulator
MRQMLEHLPFFAIMVDRSRHFVWVNRLDPTLTPEQILDHRVDEFIHPEWLPLAIETIERAFTRGEIGHYEARAYGEGQMNTWYGTTVVPLPPNENGDERALLLSNDVTKQHLAEESKRRADAEREVLAAQLQQSQKLEAIGQLAGGVAHDFNNLLLVIQTHVEFAERALAEGGDARPELAAIMTAAERAQEVTRGLLTIGRRQPRKALVFDLSDLVVSSMKLWRRMIPASIDVDLDLIGEPAFIDADRTQIEQVLMNLCLNARDAIDGTGSIQVSVTRRGLDDEIEPGWLNLTVSDTGSGMAPATLAHAFEPFFTTKPPGKGSGLGLSMVHSLTTQNGGRLSIESAWGKGTRVSVCFPEVSKHKSEVPPEPNPVVSQRTGTILVTEDDTLVRQIVVRVLQQAGYQVLEACNGQEAVDLFAEHRSQIDLVILDAVMPGMGGKEAYERIIQLQPNAKVLFSSGYSAEALPESFLEAHGIVVLAKPYRPATLLTAVERALNNVETN